MHQTPIELKLPKRILLATLGVNLNNLIGVRGVDIFSVRGLSCSPNIMLSVMLCLLGFKLPNLFS